MEHSTGLTFRVNGLTKFVISRQTKLLNLKGGSFGERIALQKASADFPLQNPQKGALKTDFKAPFSSPPLKALYRGLIFEINFVAFPP